MYDFTRIFLQNFPVKHFRLSLLFYLFFTNIANFAFAQNLRRFEFSKPQMGTTFNIILYTQNADIANHASDSAFGRIEELNQVMSDYLPDSELNNLSKTHNQWIKISDDLWDVLTFAQKVSRQSKGAFDVSVGPIVRVWRRARRRQEFPEDDKLNKARASVGYQYIKFRKRDKSVKLKKSDMRLDLGGIAKGYAVKSALEVLQYFGISSALVDGGGDLQCLNAPPDKKGWSISLGEEEGSNLLLNNQAIATSGDLYQYLEMNGQRYSHIVNPHTGIGLTDQREVAVIAPNAALADVLASTFSVLSPRECDRFIRKYNSTGYRILRNQKEQKEVYISEYFNLKTTISKQKN